VSGYSLAGRVALVTGGASGIGAAAASALTLAGARVAIFDRAPPATTKDFELGVTGDITSSRDVAEALERIEASVGSVDILVHCAGIPGPWKSALELSEQEWRTILEVNATGSFLVARALAPGMVARGFGRIIFIASIAGKEGNPLIPAYAASKGAVIAFAKSLGRELAATGVLVHTVAPAVIDTPMSTADSADQLEQMIARVPMGRMGTPAEAAALICWLASDECSFSTGAVHDLTGGRGVY
jgi:NAD(P)-dependent dehydrogenase (short-subunit alcohol dehydrogenase family)